MLLLGTSGCFTGVESTPRINASDVRKQQATNVKAEQLFLSDVLPQRPTDWSKGRALLVSDDRISLIFGSSSDDAGHLRGHKIYFDSFVTALNLTGEEEAELVFRSDDGRFLHYRVPGITMARLDTLKAFDVPFTVDLELVARVDSIMRGCRYYVRTPAWYTPDSRIAVQGLRHVEVKIDSVVAGDENFQAAVYFSLTDAELAKRACPDGKNRMLYMSIGRKRATRTFDTFFAFDNPRKLYPEIRDDVWQLIIESRVRDGMSRDECRLALGAPPAIERVPTYGGMRERWSYSDGVYLIFDDGLLSRYRL